MMEELQKRIIEKAYELGASGAGFANIEDLKKAPAFVMMPKRPHIDRVGAEINETGLPDGEVKWGEGMKSVLIISLYHPEEDTFMDSWIDDKNPPGNLKLIKIMKQLRSFIEQEAEGYQCQPLKYHVEKGGVYLKDTAVVAGLGIIGKNNLLVTPEYGPRVRLRAMSLNMDFPSTGKLDWDPCVHCAAPCRKACPQKAFDKMQYRSEDYGGLRELPGRDGAYRLQSCDEQMKLDIKNELHGEFEVPEYGKASTITPYCRACEVNCIIGKK